MTDTTEPRAAKGWWTVMWGVGLAAFGGVLPYLAGVDWTQFVNPQWAAFITGMVTILLRGITDTPIGKSK